ncbi:MAG TPA: cytochrome b N-terminal domain-containing protein [Myxococcales bacterium]
MSSRLERLFAWWNGARATMGVLAWASVLVAAATGVALASGYDVARPAQSIALLELTSLSGRVLRALHAWSSHLLIVLVLLHAVEHLASATVRKPSQGVWLRVVALVPGVLLLALTGFMLKGDAEGQLARQILSGLLDRIPLVGKATTAALLGIGDDLQIVYVHHVATLTVAVALVAIEHARRLWPTAGGVAGAIAATLVLGWLAPPALHTGVDPIIKGPWYFVGLQELLHWLSQPSWIWLLPALLLGALAAMPKLGKPAYRTTCWALSILLAAYAALSLFAGIFRGAGWELRLPWGGPPRSSLSASTAIEPLPFASFDASKVPLVQGRPEGCIGCHFEVTGLSPSHSTEALGCFSCHLGNPLAADAERAHRGMVRVPGNLDTAAQSCGRAGCHDAIVPRVQGSLMGTARGLIAVDRWAFGAQPSQDGSDAAAQLGSSPADTHLRQMCVSCHLGEIKEKPAPTSELSRGGGCAACHASYPKQRSYSKDRISGFEHPAVSVKVSEETCFGCHSRSGRISLGYAGWWDSALTETEAAKLPAGSWRKLEDGRLVSKATDDAHHAKGMTCVDCHTAEEAMGTARRPLHEEQATHVRCETCHRETPAKLAALAALPAEASAIVRLRYGEKAPAKYLVEEASGEALTNAVPREDGTFEILGKNKELRLIAKPPAPACRQLPGHARLSCRSCHETWVTQCVACHTQWDPKGIRRDIPTGHEERGAWVEFDAPPRIGPPALGVLERGGRAEIVPFAPGMVLTLNGPETNPPTPLPSAAKDLVGPGTRHLRAYAPAVPHTTTRQGLSCETCHADPQVLGYGRGKLTSKVEGGTRRWSFESAYETDRFDGKPADAWIGLMDGSSGVTTRREARSLNKEEQLKVLTVGACLGCHPPAKSGELYLRFDESLQRMRPECLAR